MGNTELCGQRTGGLPGVVPCGNFRVREVSSSVAHGTLHAGLVQTLGDCVPAHTQLGGHGLDLHPPLNVAACDLPV